MQWQYAELEKQFVVRAPLPSDYSEVMACAKDALDGLDYLPAYYHHYLHQRNRRSVVIVHKQSNKIVSTIVQELVTVL